MKLAKIAIIGAGNMGTSLMGGLIKNGYTAHSICITDPDIHKLKHLQQQWDVEITTHNLDAIKGKDVVIFAVKPTVLQAVATEIAPYVTTHKPLFLSVAAGICSDSIEHWLGQSTPIIRTMPNTPALINCGATALYANTHVSHEQRKLAESIFSSVGITVWIEDEKQMDIVTALSGSGPAYFFLIMEALQNAAETLGLPTPIAKRLTLQTAYGAARMALENKEELPILRQRVTSPNGTTEQAIRVLEEKNIRDIFSKAIHSATDRAKEIAETLGKISEK